MLNADQVWREFREKLRTGQLSSADCVPHAPLDYAAFLGSGPARPLREALLREGPPKAEWGEDKLIFTVRLGGEDELRLDFRIEGDHWRLYLFDGLTIPIRELPRLPCSDFPPHPCERHMRLEEVVSRRIDLYLRLRDRFGKEEALRWFRDGEGFRLNVEAWLPYLTLRKAFVLFVAWREERYWGQRTVIEELAEDRARLVLREHEEMLLYGIAGHLPTRISLAEYREVFEDLWQDRARAAGWHLELEYAGGDTVFHFSRLENG